MSRLWQTLMSCWPAKLACEKIDFSWFFQQVKTYFAYIQYFFHFLFLCKTQYQWISYHDEANWQGYSHLSGLCILASPGTSPTPAWMGTRFTWPALMTVFAGNKLLIWCCCCEVEQECNRKGPEQAVGTCRSGICICICFCICNKYAQMTSKIWTNLK